MNHENSRSAEDVPDTCNVDVDLGFMDDFTHQVNDFTAKISGWVENNKPVLKTGVPSSEKTSQTDPAGPSGADTDASCTVGLPETINPIVYGDPGLEDEETHEEQEISKLPLYAGPEDLVFGDSILTGSQSKADEESNTSTTDHDHLVFYG